MHCTVTKGKHRFNPISLGLYLSPKRLVRKVCFYESCRYDIGGGQSKINKLFGIGYFPSHHKNSARFGWTYNVFSKQIDIWAYTYDQGVCGEIKIGSVEIGSHYIYRLSIYKEHYCFEIGEDYSGRWKRNYYKKIAKTPTSWLGYKLGLFFGGSIPSPKSMEIIIRRV